MRVASVNQDRGIDPEGQKGAAVHLNAIRYALRSVGADVVELDECDDTQLSSRLRAELNAGAIDLIYERYALGKELTGRLALESDVPHVLEVNSPLLREAERYRNRPVSAEDAEAEAAIFRRPTRVVCVSNALAQYVHEVSGRRSGVDVEPNALSHHFADGSSGPRIEGWVPNDRFVLGFHGRLRPWHGFSRLVQLAERLLDVGVDVHLAALGKGDFGGQLRNLPAERFSHADWVEEARVPMHVRCFDLLPLTYGSDAPRWFSPLKLAEGMACGVVPVVPDMGDLPEAVGNGQSGLVVPIGDDDALFDAVLRLSQDAKLRAQLSANAEQVAKSNTWAAQVARVLNRLDKDLVARPHLDVNTGRA